MAKTVVLTGITGYIAKHIAVQLLKAGFDVRGTLRSLDRADEVRAAIKNAAPDIEKLDERLTFAALDLTQSQGWKPAFAGGDILLHTASPFPLVQPKNEQELIRPAVDGTIRALGAAKEAGIKRVVLTSSVAAVFESTTKPEGRLYDELDWTDPNAPQVVAYSKSKTLAERAAWDFVADAAPDIALTTINPGFVLGPSLDKHYGTSLRVIERILAAKDPMMPRLGFATVDVRDIATMHVRAIDRPQTHGKRILGVSDFIWFVEMAKILADQYPERKISTRQAPDSVIKMLALFDKEIRTIVPNLGVEKRVDNSLAKELLDMEFLPVDQAIIDAAKSVVQFAD